MKKWIALLLALCLLIPCAALGESTQAEEETVTEEAAEITPHQVRYYFEHRLLPQLLYEDPDQLLGFLNDNGIYTLWYNFTQNNGFDVIYAADDFDQALYQADNGTWYMQVFLPKPEDMPLCCRVYLCWNPDTDQKGYYTIEYDNYFGDAWFLCGWTEDGVHMDFGTLDAPQNPDDPEYAALMAEEIDAVLELLNSDTAPEATYDPATGVIGQ